MFSNDQLISFLKGAKMEKENNLSENDVLNIRKPMLDFIRKYNSIQADDSKFISNVTLVINIPEKTMTTIVSADSKY